MMVRISQFFERTQHFGSVKNLVIKYLLKYHFKTIFCSSSFVREILLFVIVCIHRFLIVNTHCIHAEFSINPLRVYEGLGHSFATRHTPNCSVFRMHQIVPFKDKLLPFCTTTRRNPQQTVVRMGASRAVHAQVGRSDFVGRPHTCAIPFRLCGFKMQ